MNFEDDDEKSKLLADYLVKKYRAAGESGQGKLAQALQNQDRAKTVGLFGEALSTLATARGRASGYKPDNSFFTKVSSRFDSDVDRATKDIDTAKSDFLTEDKLLQVGRDRADEDDPKSLTSQNYQALIKKMMPSANVENVPASKLKSAFPAIEGVYKIDAQRQNAIDEEARRQIERQEDRYWKIQDRNEARQARNEDKAFQANLKREDRDYERGLKQEENDRLTNIPGLEKTGEAKLTPKDADELRKTFAEADALDKDIVRLQGLIDSYGTFETGDAGAEMEALARSIQLRAKGPNMYNLGVLTGPDLALLEELVPNVGTTASGLFMSNDRTKKRLQEVLNSARGKTEQLLQSSGYRRPGPSFPLSIFNEKTGQRGTVSNQAELDEAMSEGFRPLGGR